MQHLSQLIALIVSFPLTPQIVSLTQVFGAQFHEMTQQPDQAIELRVLFLLACFVDLFADAVDPDVAIVQIAERFLHRGDLLRVTAE
jgi:hypothetical protein